MKVTKWIIWMGWFQLHLPTQQKELKLEPKFSVETRNLSANIQNNLPNLGIDCRNSCSTPLLPFQSFSPMEPLKLFACNSSTTRTPCHVCRFTIHLSQSEIPRVVRETFAPSVNEVIVDQIEQMIFFSLRFLFVLGYV